MFNNCNNEYNFIVYGQFVVGVYWDGITERFALQSFKKKPEALAMKVNWKVYDNTTSTLQLRFYRHLLSQREEMHKL